MRHIYVISILFISIILQACSSDEPGKDPVTRRTLLVYMVATNDLGSRGYATRDINEMIAGMADVDTENADVLVYQALLSETPALKRVTASGLETLKTYDTSLPSVSVERMAQVFSDMRAIAPADKYGLVLWSHATGWITTSGTLKQARSWGVDNGKEMAVHDLGRALVTHPWDFIYMDCCYMGNIESIYELRNAAPVIVASPSETPLDGMPYHLNLKWLTAETPDPVAAARSTFEYYNGFSGEAQSIAMSVYDMSYIHDLADACRDIYAANTTLPEGFEPQTYGYRWSSAQPQFDKLFYDLAHTSRALAADAQLAESFNRALDKFVIYADHTPYMWNRLPLNDCHGIASFFPVNEALGETYDYSALEWVRDVLPAN